MELPITNYEITYRDIIEICIGSLIVIFSIVGSIICVNIVSSVLLTNNKSDITLNIFCFFVHIIFILLFIMLIRYIASIHIANRLILDSTFSFIGPTIGISSLYYSSNLKLIISIITNIINKSIL